MIRGTWGTVVAADGSESFRPEDDELACHRVYAAYERAAERVCRSKGKWAANADEVIAQHERPNETAEQDSDEEEETMARPDMNERAEKLIAACVGFIAGEGRNPTMKELGKAAGLDGPTDAAIAQAAKKALAPVRGSRVEWSKSDGVYPLEGGGPSKAKAQPAPRAKPQAIGLTDPTPRMVASEYGVVELLQSKRAELAREVAVIDRMLAAAKVA